MNLKIFKIPVAVFKEIKFIYSYSVKVLLVKLSITFIILYAIIGQPLLFKFLNKFLIFMAWGIVGGERMLKSNLSTGKLFSRTKFLYK